MASQEQQQYRIPQPYDSGSDPSLVVLGELMRDVLCKLIRSPEQSRCAAKLFGILIPLEVVAAERLGTVGLDKESTLFITLFLSG